MWAIGIRNMNAQYVNINVSYLSPNTINKLGFVPPNNLENFCIISDDFFKTDIGFDLYSLSLIFELI